MTRSGEASSAATFWRELGRHLRKREGGGEQFRAEQHDRDHRGGLRGREQRFVKALPAHAAEHHREDPDGERADRRGLGRGEPAEVDADDDEQEDERRPARRRGSRAAARASGSFGARGAASGRSRQYRCHDDHVLQRRRSARE